MYQVEAIKTELRNLVGWKQEKSPDLKIAKSLTESNSGIYFQSQHPLLTIENLMAYTPNFEHWTFPDYDPEKEYHYGDKVQKDGKIYRALTDSTGQEPPNEDYWEKWDRFSEWIEQETAEAIVKTIQKFNTEQIAMKARRGVLQNLLLYVKPTERVEVENENKVVGFEIIPMRVYGIALDIQRVGLCFNAPCTVTIHAKHSSNKLPPYSKTVDYTKSEEVQWFNMDDFKLPFVSDDNFPGGTWYLYYDQSEIHPVKAIEAVKPEITSTRYAHIKPFVAESDELLHESIEKGKSGMTLQLRIYSDITSYVLANRDVFTEVIAKGVAVHFLRMMAFNPEVRINRRESNVRRGELLYELDGDSGSMKKSGLGHQYDMAMKALSVDMQDFDKLFLAKGKLKYRTL